MLKTLVIMLSLSVACSGATYAMEESKPLIHPKKLRVDPAKKQEATNPSYKKAQATNPKFEDEKLWMLRQTAL